MEEDNWNKEENDGGIGWRYNRMLTIMCKRR
jgi:hypothetical protein